jgi:uncharacterized protein (DUF2252 family)
MATVISRPKSAFHPSREERYEKGKLLRNSCPRSSHAEWKPTHDRPSTLQLLEQSSQGRIPQLVPMRYGRMLRSPFTFYRGAALNMAADLAATPVTGLRVQVCGDCHLCNFGAFATPERRLIADINDLDETLPGPWEWDVKRLAASFVLAGRNNGHSERDARDAATACVRSYREHMAEFAEVSVLDVWYARVDLEGLTDNLTDKEAQRRLQRRIDKARDRCVLEHDFPELASHDGWSPSIKENPPLIFHYRDYSQEKFDDIVRQAFAAYRESMPPYRRVLLDRYKLMDIAIKVVGVGSVGTRCAIMLLMADDDDPLFLQVKEARPSVLEPYAGKSEYPNHGQRVVQGHFMMQAASDLFLGWTEGSHGRHFYIRQLRDMKIKPLVEIFTPGVMLDYAEICGRILARAHARTGDPVILSGYLGKNDKFDEAIARFSVAYADQSERDHDELTAAVRNGKLEVVIEDV